MLADIQSIYLGEQFFFQPPVAALFFSMDPIRERTTSKFKFSPVRILLRKQHGPMLLWAVAKLACRHHSACVWTYWFPVKLANRLS